MKNDETSFTSRFSKEFPMESPNDRVAKPAFLPRLRFRRFSLLLPIGAETGNCVVVSLRVVAWAKIFQGISAANRSSNKD